MLMPMKVAPKGLPRWRRCFWGLYDAEGEEEGFESEVLRRKSWVIAMPIEAKEREVRSQARKVRSVVYLLAFCSFLRLVGLGDILKTWRVRKG